MKIVCHREALLAGISIAAAVAPSRSTKAILKGILVKATRDGVIALATDLEVAVCSKIDEVIVEREGKVVLAASTLVDILRSIEGREVTIDSDGRYCQIRSEDAEYKLVTDDPDDFPEIQPAPDDGIPIPRVFIEEMFGRTGFAAARDIGRYAINGVLVELGERRIRFVATDGRRLGVASRDLPDAAFEVRRAIVPAKGLVECLRGSDGCSTVRIIVEPDRVVLASDRASITTKPVEGEFPDYTMVIPQSHTGKVTASRDKLLAAFRKVSVMAGDDMRAVKVVVSAQRITISSQVEGRGEARTEIEADTGGQADLVADYNPDFIVDFLKALPSQPVSFEFTDGNAAAVYRLEDSDDRYVIMPITTS